MSRREFGCNLRGYEELKKRFSSNEILEGKYESDEALVDTMTSRSKLI